MTCCCRDCTILEVEFIGGAGGEVVSLSDSFLGVGFKPLIRLSTASTQEDVT